MWRIDFIISRNISAWNSAAKMTIESTIVRIDYDKLLLHS